MLLAGVAFLSPLLTACSYAPAKPTTEAEDLRPAVISGAGDIAAAVERYRTLLGPDSGGEPGSKPTGPREINWDKVPDELAAAKFLPGDFFNAPKAPRARGGALFYAGPRCAGKRPSRQPYGDRRAVWSHQSNLPWHLQDLQ